MSYFGYDHGEDELIEKEERKPFHFWFGIGLIIASSLVVFSSCDVAQAETASWYSYESCIKEGTSGRFTASGEKFNHNELTAASWKYPFGTKVKVTNLKNGKSTTVKINDRGPSKRLVKKGRVIDLSKAAFQSISPLSAGVIPVRIEVLK